MGMLSQRTWWDLHEDAGPLGTAASPQEHQLCREDCIPMRMLIWWRCLHPCEDAGSAGMVAFLRRCWLHGDCGIPTKTLALGLAASLRGCWISGDDGNPMRMPALRGWLHPHKDTNLVGTSAFPQGHWVSGNGDIPRFRGRGDTASAHRGLVRQQLLNHFDELVLLVRVEAAREEQGRCGQTKFLPIPTCTKQLRP